MREKTIEKYLINKTKKASGMCVKFWPIFFAGFPDRIVLLPGGTIIFVELKAPGKDSTPLQVKVQNTIRGLGFRVEVCDSKEQIANLW